MARPLLVWPQGISEHLDDAHLEAILAHELRHVRRRDNLAAAVHMVVEAVFWFHPLVWWLGARLVDERERACDEEVLELGSQRHVYAESILKVCEFCLGSPLPCVAGVTGADLKKRMVHIMSEQKSRKLDFRRKLLLTVAGLAAIAAPVVFGLVNATPGRAQSQAESSSAATPRFESFSIKPSSIKPSSIKPSQTSEPMATDAGTSNHMTRVGYGPDGFVATNVTLQTLIQEAYGVQANQIADGPDWLKLGTFDVEAKVDKSEGFQLGMGPNRSKAQQMLQAALAEHTKLVLHQETKDLPVYALAVDPDGAKLQPSQSTSELTGSDAKPKQMFKVGIQLGEGQVREISARSISADDLARQLSMQLGSAVLNQTDLKGLYDFNLHWTPDPSRPSGGIETALQQQLGLKLEPKIAPMQILVIDHIEKPAEN